MKTVYGPLLHSAAALSLCMLAVSTVGAGEQPSGQTETVSLDTLVAEVVQKNPELEFYRAEIAAAKGGRRTPWQQAGLGMCGPSTGRRPGVVGFRRATD